MEHNPSVLIETSSKGDILILLSFKLICIQLKARSET